MNPIRSLVAARLVCVICVATLTLLAGCGAGTEPSVEEEPVAAPTSAVEWALAIHAGAGVIPKTMAEEKREEYFEALRQALGLGRDLLEEGTAGLDVVERVIRFLEDSPLFNAGKGAVFTHDGDHELDASIMDGRTLACGAVGGVRTVKNPISLARMVMTETRHVLLVAEGAERFADEMGVERVEPEYFFTQRRYDAWQEKLAEGEETEAAGDGEEKHGTVGVVVRDRDGNLAAGTSTGGLTDKRFGRIGDSPIIGAGTYANNRTVAISCTGVGEEFIRHNVAYDVSALMKYRGLPVREAAEAVVLQKLQPGDGGLIAVDKDGNVALVFNTPGMFRGAADSSGRFDVAIWE
jgi:beta-aspartyl-peptidase (threonine type)